MCNLDGREKLHRTKFHGLNGVTCSSEPDLKVVKKFKTRLSNPTPIQIRLSRILNLIQIHHQVENPSDLNASPCSSLESGRKRSGANDALELQLQYDAYRHNASVADCRAMAELNVLKLRVQKL